MASILTILRARKLKFQIGAITSHFWSLPFEWWMKLLTVCAMALKKIDLFHWRGILLSNPVSTPIKGHPWIPCLRGLVCSACIPPK